MRDNLKLAYKKFEASRKGKEYDYSAEETLIINDPVTDDRLRSAVPEGVQRVRSGVLGCDSFQSEARSAHRK